MSTSIQKKMKAEDFDKAFEKGDVTKFLNLKKVKIHYPIQRVNVDFPKDMLKRMDEEASRIGVTRTSLIKVWVAERLDHLIAA